MSIFLTQLTGMNDCGQRHEGSRKGKSKTNFESFSGDSCDTELPEADSSSIASSRNKSYARESSPTIDKRLTVGAEGGPQSPTLSDTLSSTTSLHDSKSPDRPISLMSTSASNTNDCSLNEGARPKTIQHLNVASADRPNFSEEKRELEKYRRQLLSVRIPNDFYKSAPVKALHFMLDQNNKDQQILTEMAVKCLKVKLNRFPKSSELLELLYECDMEEEAIVRAFVEIIKTPEKGATSSINVHTNNSELEGKQNAQRKSIQQITIQTSAEREISIESTSLPQVNFDEISSNSTHIDSSVSGHFTCDLDNLAETPTEDPSLSRETVSSLTSPVEQEQSSKSPNLLEMPSATTQSKNKRLGVTETENRYLKERLTCAFCNERPIETTLLPCSHFMLCVICSGKCSHCPLCQAKILAEVKTYIC